MRKHTKSFEDLVKENKEELLKDKQAIEKLEKLIEKRHENIKLVNIKRILKIKELIKMTFTTLGTI